MYFPTIEDLRRFVEVRRGDLGAWGLGRTGFLFSESDDQLFFRNLDDFNYLNLIDRHRYAKNYLKIANLELLSPPDTNLLRVFAFYICRMRPQGAIFIPSSLTAGFNYRPGDLVVFKEKDKCASIASVRAVNFEERAVSIGPVENIAGCGLFGMTVGPSRSKPYRTAEAVEVLPFSAYQFYRGHKNLLDVHWPILPYNFATVLNRLRYY